MKQHCSLRDVANRLVAEGESALPWLEEVMRDTMDAGARDFRLPPGDVHLLSHFNTYYVGIVETVGYDPKTVNASALVTSMLERIPVFRNGIFSSSAYIQFSGERRTSEFVHAGYHHAPIDVLRAMAKYGWQLSTNGVYDALGDGALNEKGGERLRLIVEYDLLRGIDLYSLHDRCYHSRGFGGGVVMRWLMQHYEKSMRFMMSWGPASHEYARWTDEPWFCDAVARFVRRRDCLSVTSVLLCAEGGEWTFAFYKLFKFLY